MHKIKVKLLEELLRDDSKKISHGLNLGLFRVSGFPLIIPSELMYKATQVSPVPLSFRFVLASVLGFFYNEVSEFFFPIIMECKYKDSIKTIWLQPR